MLLLLLLLALLHGVEEAKAMGLPPLPFLPP